MAKLKDMTGLRFGRLIVLNREPNIDGHTMWRCKCDCGKIKIAEAYSLRSGKTKSCGCLSLEMLEKGRTKHGLYKTKLYGHFEKMVDRCENKNHNSYKNYGGRGIAICSEWRHDFKAFYDWSMKNGFKEGLSIDRIDNNKGYSPDNCRWATQKEQMNNIRTNRRIEYNGVTHTLSEWSEITNISKSCLFKRIRSGWGAEELLTIPSGAVKNTKQRKAWIKNKDGIGSSGK